MHACLTIVWLEPACVRWLSLSFLGLECLSADLDCPWSYLGFVPKHSSLNWNPFFIHPDALSHRILLWGPDGSSVNCCSISSDRLQPSYLANNAPNKWSRSVAHAQLAAVIVLLGHGNRGLCCSLVVAVVSRSDVRIDARRLCLTPVETSTISHCPTLQRDSLPTYLSIYLTIYIHTYIYMHLCLSFFLYLSISFFLSLFIDSFMHSFIYLFNCLCAQ